MPTLPKSIACAAVLSLISITPVLACDFCEREVTLNKNLSECYLSLYEAELQRMQDNAMPAQLINLAVCEGAETATRGSGSLPQPGNTSKDITMSFLLDADGLSCLAKDLKKTKWSPSPVKTFEVKREC